MCMIISSFNSPHFISLEKDGAIDTPDSHLTPIAITVAFYQRRASPPWQDAENFNKHSKILDLYPCLFWFTAAWINFPRQGVIQPLSFKVQPGNKECWALSIFGFSRHKGVLEEWIMLSKDQCPPNHHMWGTTGLLLPGEMLGRMKPQRILHLPKDRIVFLRRQHLKFSVGLVWMQLQDECE